MTSNGSSVVCSASPAKVAAIVALAFRAGMTTLIVGAG
jgi:hypothetical protein